ncbi:hypothetical protein [Fluviicola sp.]|uniref:hypothetical protein n=1 Tax=Fluviicola sp. TaxID=1917219 RepID=UPI002839D4B0|nr:hypothetical protein [Fluviicola sp.]MDR0803202.1 hypothetical protein [Fluviicola sp.]
MKYILCFFVCLPFFSVFGQEKKFKDYFNEFHVSLNHGVPFYLLYSGLVPEERTFFGGGLGISHVFRADRVVGARAGLELECFHIWDRGGFPPEFDYAVKNRHFYLTNLTIPINLRLSFGRKTRFIFELGGRFGLILFPVVVADVGHYSSDWEGEVFVREKRAGNVGLGIAGLNTGIGMNVPLNEKLDLLIRPDAGANLFSLEDTRINLYGRLCVGIHLK